jgi:hypothetical protein
VDDVAIWRRALTASEIAALYQAGQQGRSLGELLRQPSPLLTIVEQRLLPEQNLLQIFFRNSGAWSAFQLQRAAHPAGPFLLVPGLAPVDLGGGQYRFDYPMTSDVMEFFRVVAD